jgi:hypothetical protein
MLLGLLKISAMVKDPTKDPNFQKVVRHFLTTPPRPHKPTGKKAKKRPKGGASAKPKTA